MQYRAVIFTVYLNKEPDDSVVAVVSLTRRRDFSAPMVWLCSLLDVEGYLVSGASFYRTKTVLLTRIHE